MPSQMKTKILSLIAWLAISMGLASCHDGEGGIIKPAETPEGQINLRSLAVEINNAEKVISSSRAQIDLSEYLVDILTREGQTVKSFSYGSMPEIVTLPAGDYTARVRSHEVLKAEWDHPYFHGEKEFNVKGANITDVGTVTCSLKSIKVTIRFSETLRKFMSDDCKVTVIANDEGRLEFTPGETRSGYFQAIKGSSTLVAEFTGTVGGNFETKRITCDDVEAGHHRIITFKLQTPNGDDVDENGLIDINDGIFIDTTVEEDNLNFVITPTESNLGTSDRPGSDEAPDDNGGDPDNPDTPTPPSLDDDSITFTSNDVDFDNINPVKKPVVVKIHAEYGIEHLNVKISSDNNDFLASAGDLLPLQFDLAYPANDEDAKAFASIGLPVRNDVIGKTDLDFDISELVPLLSSFVGTHHFQLSVTDSKANQLVKTLTFKAESKQ